MAESAIDLVHHVPRYVKELDFSDILPEEVEVEMKAAAEISMGTEVSGEDMENILALGEQA